MNYREVLKTTVYLSIFVAANLSAQPTGGNASTSTPVPTRDQWLKVTIESNASEYIRTEFKAFLTSQMTSDTEDEIEVIEEEQPTNAQVLTAEAKRTLETKLLDFDSIARTDSELYFANFKDTTWAFFRESPNSWPSQLRITRFTGADSYSVEMTIYCAENNTSCNALVSASKNIKPPQPDYLFGKSMKDQWLQIVKAEPCDPNKPVSMPNPIYPPDEAREGIVGQVLVRFEYNKCGDAVDVTIQKSSRNRNLDRAALEATRRWRIEIPVETKDPAVQAVLIPVLFHR